MRALEVANRKRVNVVMEEWRSGGVEEGRSGGVEEWRSE
jgi:hypothetical protein